ncbi:hypothetical protein JCM8208_003855 [Rhodotorula glutinis]
MSVLTDPDFLLHALQLSYLRHVLPNHASLSSATASASMAVGGGTAAYNLVDFAPPDDLASNNPYIALSGTADPQRWPELGTRPPSGRRSPPLAPQLARDAAPRRGERVRGGLQYSQTIGKGVASAGMKVEGGRARTWKGRGRLSRAGDDVDGSSSRPSSPPDGLAPPPVVIHSPTKTPRQTPAIRTADPSSAVDLAPVPSTSSLADRARLASKRSLSSSFSTGGAGASAPPSPRGEPERSSSQSLFDQSSTSTPVPSRRRRPSRASSSGSADSDFPDGPAPSRTGPPPPRQEVPVFQLPPGLRVRERRRVNIRPGEILAPGAAAPTAPRPPSPSSSIDSDFGVRVPAPTAATAPVEPKPDPPTFQLPPGMRVRERRRVNIRPGQALTAAEPAPPRPPAPAPPPAAPSSLSSSPDSDFADRMPARTRAQDKPAEPPAFQLPPGLRVRERRRVDVPPGGVVLAPPQPQSQPSLAAPLSPEPEGRPATRRRQTSNASSSFASDFGGGLPTPPTPATPAPVLAPLARMDSAPPPLPSPARAQEQEQGEQQQQPAFQLPPGLKVRERRRVNIRPGAVLASAAESGASASGEPAPPSPAPAPAPSQPTPAPSPAPAALRAPPSRRRSSRPASPSLSAPYFPPRSTYLSRPPSRPSAIAAPPQRSALSALLAAQDAAAGSSGRGRGGLANPFSTLYAACVARSGGAGAAGAGGAEGDALRLRLFFPRQGEDEPVEVSVKRDVSVEEVIGVGLWAYWEEGREPGLESEVREDEAREGRETARWDLRIVEDGEVDEDFPALERTRAISAFAFTEFAVVRADNEQVDDNLAKQATIVRRPSRILASAAHSAVAPPTAAPTAALDTARPFDPQTCAAGSALAVPVLLKCVLPPLTAAEGLVALSNGEEVGVQTTIQVPSDMYLADVLELILRKRGIRSPARDWALVVRLQDGDLVIPLDRTVESLGEQRELELVPRAQVGPGGVRKSAVAGGGNQDPSQSIFPPSHLAADAAGQPAYKSSAAAAAASAAPYLHFNVLRKLPMSLGGRHARVVAIDGDYLHFMPPEANLPALTRGRTTSFHVSAVRDCKVSRRSATAFKIVVHTKRGVDKRYDFEAESAEQAREIVAVVRRVMEFYRNERRAR